MSVHPLSWSQYALWIEYVLAGEQPAYQMCVVARVLDGLDRDRLHVALQELVQRHDALRTTIDPRAGEPLPVQVVHDRWPVDFAIVPSGATSWRQLRRELSAEANRQFDLTREPPFLVRLFSGAPGDFLLFVFHHIAWDFEAMLVAFNDLAEFHAASRSAGEVAAPPPGAGHAEHARWEAALLDSPRGRRSMDFWQRTMTALPPATEIPADRPRPAVRSYAGTVHVTRLGADVGAQMDRVAADLGVSRYSVLLAAFAVFLGRAAGQDEVVFGTPGSHRFRPELRGTVGNFANTMVIGTGLDGGVVFSDLVRDLRGQVLQALAHGEVPIPAVLDRLQRPRDTSRSPVCDVLFSYVRAMDQARPDRTMFAAGQGATDLGGLRLRSLPLECDGAAFDLQVDVVDATDSLATRWAYRTDLFDRATVRRLSSHFASVLRQALATPHTPLATLDGLPQRERQVLLHEWAGLDVATDPPAALHELVEQQAARTPDATAVISDQAALSYRDLDTRADRLATRLRRDGVGPECRVAVCVHRSPELVVSMLAVLKTGGAIVPVDPDYPAARLEYLLTDARVATVVTATATVAHVSALSARLRSGQRTVVEDERPATPAGGSRETVPTRGEVLPDNLAYVIYTSGSTGRPKGSMNTHGAVVNQLRWIRDYLGLDSSERVLHKNSISFDVALWEIFLPLITGGVLVLSPPGEHREPGALVRRCEREGVTTICFVPSMLEQFLVRTEDTSLPALRRVVCAGEVLPAQLVARCFDVLGVEVHNIYGPAEAAIAVTAAPCSTSRPGRPVPIGRPVWNTQVRVLDAEMRLAPVGVPGELYIAGVQVGRGYIGRPDLTAERFLPDPYRPGRMYRTGDIARWNADGQLEFLGRVDHQVKVRGHRVEPEEVQHHLESLPGITAAAVRPHYDPDGVRLVAYVVADDPAAVIPGAVRAALRHQLPEYMLPSGVVVLPELPRGPHGKTDLTQLPDHDSPVRVMRPEYVAPVSPLEEELATIWASLLDLDRVGRHDNIFDLGGSSLTAARLSAQMQSVFGIGVTVEDVFTHPTLETFTVAVLERGLVEVPAAEDDVPDAEPGQRR